MAINAQDMNDYCMGALINYAQGAYKNEMKSPKSMKVLADSMKEYLEDNLEVEYSWQGVNPSSGAKDPVTKYTATVKFASFNLDEPMSLNPGLSGKIMASVATGIISAPAGFSLSVGSFTIPTLTLPSGSAFQSAMMDCIFRPICDWIKTCLPGTPMSGSHSSFTGTGTMAKIS
jgi:hypothetical protein